LATQVVSDGGGEPKREYRVAEHQEGYMVQSRAAGSHRWNDGPIFLSDEKAVEAMHRLAGSNPDVDGGP
jgi:hypothetical protein